MVCDAIFCAFAQPTAPDRKEEQLQTPITRAPTISAPCSCCQPVCVCCCSCCLAAIMKCLTHTSSTCSVKPFSHSGSAVLPVRVNVRRSAPAPVTRQFCSCRGNSRLTACINDTYGHYFIAVVGLKGSGVRRGDRAAAVSSNSMGSRGYSSTLKQLQAPQKRF
jgi:hypothetical protein